MANNSQLQYVLLQCVSRGSKLKVQMISSAPYIKGMFCQFPRDIRQEHMYYVVKSEGIKLRGKFYSAMQKNIIVCQSFNYDDIKRFIGDLGDKIKIDKIYGDDTSDECVICFSSPKDSVISPCGHYMTCRECTLKCKQCPICRGNIVEILKKSDMIEEN